MEDEHEDDHNGGAGGDGPSLKKRRGEGPHVECRILLASKVCVCVRVCACRRAKCGMGQKVRREVASCSALTFFFFFFCKCA